MSNNPGLTCRAFTDKLVSFPTTLGSDGVEACRSHFVVSDPGTDGTGQSMMHKSNVSKRKPPEYIKAVRRMTCISVSSTLNSLGAMVGPADDSKRARNDNKVISCGVGVSKGGVRTELGLEKEFFVETFVGFLHRIDRLVEDLNRCCLMAIDVIGGISPTYRRENFITDTGVVLYGPFRLDVETRMGVHVGVLLEQISFAIWCTEGFLESVAMWVHKLADELGVPYQVAEGSGARAVLCAKSAFADFGAVRDAWRQSKDSVRNRLNHDAKEVLWKWARSLEKCEKALSDEGFNCNCKLRTDAHSTSDLSGDLVHERSQENPALGGTNG